MEAFRPRVLVIDPDPSVRALLAAVARRRGFDADTAASREEALQRTRMRTYDAITLEPRMAGGEALLRELPARNLIVATTATHGMPKGVTAVLRKPFLIDELSSLIDGYWPASA
jgi:DNA-binding response OmpR family regulator